MIFQLILGVFTGVVFGLIPALHINFVSFLFLYLGLFFIFPNYFYFFLTLSLSQLITNYIPQTFFSVPNTENIMSLFPLHRLFLEQKAYQGIFLCFIGSFFGALFSIFLLPFLYLLFTALLGFNLFISLAILFTFASFILYQKTLKEKIIVFIILFSSGLLGLFTLKYNFFVKEPLFVCVIGLFTFPLLLKSIFEKPKKVIQKIPLSFSYPKKSSLVFSFFGSLMSLVVILVPSFSSSLGGVLFSRLKKNLSTNDYVVLFSSISISALIFSYFLAMFFNKPRLGYIAILLSEKLVLQKQELFLFIISIILSVSITLLILFSLLKDFIHFFNNQDLNKLNFLVLIISFIFIIFITDFKSLLVFVLSILIGFIPLQYNKSRVYLMGYIMLPTLLFYL